MSKAANHTAKKQPTTADKKNAPAGMRLVSNTPRVKLTITDAHIDKGINSSGHCAIAEAVREQVKGARRISVDVQSIRWTDSRKGLRYCYLTPRIGQIIILQNDRAIRPKPTSFWLRGATVTTAHHADKSYKGKGTRMKPVHKLGRKRVISKHGETEHRPSTLGGKPPMRIPKQYQRRGWGLKALTVDDVIPPDATQEQIRRMDASARSI